MVCSFPNQRSRCDGRVLPIPPIRLQELSLPIEISQAGFRSATTRYAPVHAAGPRPDSAPRYTPLLHCTILLDTVQHKSYLCSATWIGRTLGSSCTGLVSAGSAQLVYVTVTDRRNLE